MPAGALYIAGVLAEPIRNPVSRGLALARAWLVVRSWSEDSQPRIVIAPDSFPPRDFYGFDFSPRPPSSLSFFSLCLFFFLLDVTRLATVDITSRRSALILNNATGIIFDSIIAFEIFYVDLSKIEYMRSASLDFDAVRRQKNNV